MVDVNEAGAEGDSVNVSVVMNVVAGGKVVAGAGVRDGVSSVGAVVICIVGVAGGGVGGLIAIQSATSATMRLHRPVTV
jgi:hypothetical protein